MNVHKHGIPLYRYGNVCTCTITCTLDLYLILLFVYFFLNTFFSNQNKTVLDY